MTLIELDKAAWINLERAGTDSGSALRYLNFCTVDRDGHPQARLVVLRAANREDRTIEIHTDIRSAKWREVSANPAVTVLAFDAARGQQLRLRGKAERHGPGSPKAADAWDRLSQWTRSTYTGGPPGESSADVELGTASAGGEKGKFVFGVIVFQAFQLDWFQLKRGGNRRAMFLYGSGSELVDAREINP